MTTGHGGILRASSGNRWFGTLNSASLLRRQGAIAGATDGWGSKRDVEAYLEVAVSRRNVRTHLVAHRLFAPTNHSDRLPPDACTQ